MAKQATMGMWAQYNSNWSITIDHIISNTHTHMQSLSGSHFKNTSHTYFASNLACRE